MKKKLLLATFTNKKYFEKVKKLIIDNFNLKEKDLFYFEIIDSDNLLITYIIETNEGEKFDLNKKIKKTIIAHKRGTAIYTINALNKLIESQNEYVLGNIDYKSFIIDWSKYQDSLILINDNKLLILKIKRFFI